MSPEMRSHAGMAKQTSGRRLARRPNRPTQVRPVGGWVGGWVVGWLASRSQHRRHSASGYTPATQSGT
jgi:hypothetical protein